MPSPTFPRRHRFLSWNGASPLDGGRRTPRARGAGAISRSQAIRDSYQVLRSVAPNLTNPALKIALSLVLSESGYGIIPKLGFVEEDGTPTHNWGAIKGTGDAGCFLHGDSDESKKVCFKRNSSAEEGARVFMKTWGSSDTLAAAQAGDIYGVARAMRGHNYYTGFDCTRDSAHPWGIVLCAANGYGVAGCAPATPENVDCAIAQYATMIKNGVGEVSAALGQPNDDTHIDYPSSAASGVGRLVVGAGLIAAGWYFVFGKGYTQYTSKFVRL